MMGMMPAEVSVRQDVACVTAMTILGHFRLFRHSVTGAHDLVDCSVGRPPIFQFGHTY